MSEFDIYNPTDEHRQLREMVARFTADYVEDQAEEYDARGEMNQGLFRQLADLGLLGITIPADHGGAEVDATAAVIVHEELSKSDPGFALAYLAHAMLFVNNFYHCSNEEQRARVLPRVTSGEWIAAMAMTEPGAGTDVLGMSTRAARDGDDYVLNGRKIFITHGPEAQVFLVYAKVEGRITSFLVHRDSPGFSSSPKIPKMGMRASTMCELMFDDCRVPTRDVLGDEGQGITHMMRNLELERLTLAAMSLGIAERCVDIMVRYSTERQAFGKPISELGQIQRHIGESYAATAAMRAMIYDIASKVSPTSRNRVDTDAAKLFASTAAKQVADNAMQVLGGYGYCTEYKVERLLRDAKLLEIGGGTIESHHKNITRDLCRAR